MVLDKAMREEIVRVPRRDNKRTSPMDDDGNGNDNGNGHDNGTGGEEDEGVDVEDIKADVTEATHSRSRSRTSSSTSPSSFANETTNGAGPGSGELQRRGLLGPRVKGVLVLACKVLEKGERFGI